MTNSLSFPNDENGDVLRRMQASGDDLSKARYISFTVVFPSEENAAEFGEHFSKMSYKVTLKNTSCIKELPWDVVVIKHMVPKHAAITSFEEELDAIAKTLGGRNDGWGCFEQ